MTTQKLCGGPECDRVVTEGVYYCAAHRYQLNRGMELAPLQSRASAIELDSQHYVPQPGLAGAACSESELDFVEVKNSSEAWERQRVCEGCPLQLACREYALSTHNGADSYPVTGVWGGVWIRSDLSVIEMPEKAPGVAKNKSGTWDVSVTVGSKRAYGGRYEDLDVANDRADEVRRELRSAA